MRGREGLKYGWSCPHVGSILHEVGLVPEPNEKVGYQPPRSPQQLNPPREPHHQNILGKQGNQGQAS